MNNRFEKRFAKLKERNEGAFMPFVTLCDPDKATSLEILKSLLNGGADALELGFPFSDPCADGPIIQNADKRALNSGASTDDFFEVVKDFRNVDDEIPISILVYANVVVARGIRKFFADAAAAGIDAVLIPDIPSNMIHTSGDFEQAAKDAGVDTVLIAPPNASDKILETISKHSKGYTYVLSRYGITGTENTFGKPVRVIEKIKELNGAAPVLGFGISTPEHVSKALEIGAAGAIAGSACVKIIEENLHGLPLMLAKLEEYVRSMKAATLKA
ncbi:tryptophan synthase subunit alpha [uncultured Succinivibrio sp.]|uniref:tryptophan synthase subunit alpha n=1 Tax=uncultured Succinivibrio sp. TaxID=540749 RepID=UPI0025DF2F80|nr:tryptophan synthase subunit alpha [uncultured Succinivibrio sp.]